jgi:hypothetical protein
VSEERGACNELRQPVRNGSAVFAFVRLVIAAPEKASEDTQLRRKGG